MLRYKSIKYIKNRQTCHATGFRFSFFSNSTQLAKQKQNKGKIKQWNYNKQKCLCTMVPWKKLLLKEQSIKCIRYSHTTCLTEGV